MEEWEKKFQDLEREVDAEFDRAKAASASAPEPEPASPPPARAAPSRKPPRDAGSDVLGDLKRAAATTALQKAAETSLVKVGPRKAAFYGICAVIAVLLIMKNIGFIIFAGVVLGGLYWWLFTGDAPPEGPADEDDDEEDDD